MREDDELLDIKTRLLEACFRRNVLAPIWKCSTGHKGVDSAIWGQEALEFLNSDADFHRSFNKIIRAAKITD